MSAAKPKLRDDGKCLRCGHSKRNHMGGVGLCVVASCKLCLHFTRPAAVCGTSESPQGDKK